jgi:hypothetical protein
MPEDQEGPVAPIRQEAEPKRGLADKLVEISNNWSNRLRNEATWWKTESRAPKFLKIMQGSILNEIANISGAPAILIEGLRNLKQKFTGNHSEKN